MFAPTLKGAPATEGRQPQVRIPVAYGLQALSPTQIVTSKGVGGRHD